MATAGHYLGLIPALDRPEMAGANPEVARGQMAGLNFIYGLAQEIHDEEVAGFRVDTLAYPPRRGSRELAH
jgi:xylose isomerase